MSIFRKLITAIRGGATEVGESIVDNQAIRILEQEIRDSKNAINNAKTSLTSIMAEKMATERKVKELKSKISEHEGYVMKALESNKEALAIDVANKIAEFEHELTVQQGIFTGYSTKVASLKKSIKQADRNIEAMSREVSVVKTTEQVQKANELAAAQFSGSNSALNSATDSLSRIKARQQKREDQMAAAMQLESDNSGDDLQSRLQTAGIVDSNSSGSSVLDRLRQKKSTS